MKKKFLFVLPAAKLSGGAQRVMFNLARHLVLNNQDVTLITMTRGFEKGWDVLNDYSNFNWIIGEYKSEKSSLIPITLQILELDRKHHFDYVVSSHIHVNSFLSTLKRLGAFSKAYLISRESSMVFENKNEYKRYFYILIYKFIYGNQDLLICQTDSMKKSLLDNLGFKPVDTVNVIPNPVDIKFIKSKLANDNSKPLNQRYIVACGRFVKIKQFDLLIDAFANVHASNPEFKLIILGDGPEKANLLAKVKNLNLESRILFPGNVDNPFLYFYHAEVGVISSKTEGFPNVLLEMMASGIKRIVTTPCTEALKNIPNLIITENSSKHSITNGIQKAIDENLDYSEEYKLIVTKNHSIENFWESIEQSII